MHRAYSWSFTFETREGGKDFFAHGVYLTAKNGDVAMLGTTATKLATDLLVRGSPYILIEFCGRYIIFEV